MKVLETIGKIISSIFGWLLGIVIAVCLLPFAILFVLISIPTLIIQEIWGPEHNE